MTTLVLADVAGSTLGDTTAKAVSAAKAIGAPIHILVAGEGVGAAAERAATIEGVEKVLVADDATYAHQRAEPLADLLVRLAEAYETVLAPSTATTKNAMPRAAALLDVMQVSDIVKVVSSDTFERPIYAGNAIQTVQTKEPKRIITVQTAAFEAAPMGAAAAPIAPVAAAANDPGLSQFTSEDVTKSDRPELTSAKTVVSGGRALANADNFQKLIVPLADTLHAAVGASRAAVDSGYAPNDWQVGQTGKIVAPELYVAVGISGAIQHLAGMKDSKVIVAINKDEEAPIFQVADYGLVGDLFTVVPELTETIAKRGG
jgi:electron transfer flavoprotein alpha subunit